MTILPPRENTYEQFAEQYAQSQQRPDNGSFSWNYDLVIPQLLNVVGDVTGCSALDAGCGEGIVARFLADFGAKVTAIDVSPRLVELGKAQDSQNQITWIVRDLSLPLASFDETFDVVVSNLVLNDVSDYCGFARTLGAVTKVDGRAVLSLTNPYSAVMREKVHSYFDSGEAIPYAWAEPKVYHFHRTMQDYVSAFRDGGFLLNSLTDVQMPNEMVKRLPDSRKEEIPWFDLYHRYPFFVILDFVKVG
ncbi:MAG: class I SAM-dependent methyltransferase [Chloroflexota bacterium]